MASKTENVSIWWHHHAFVTLMIGLLPDTQNCELCMRRECLERFPRHRLQKKPLISDPDMHHGTCITHVPWCMSGSLTRGGGENDPGIPGACATRNFTYLARGPWKLQSISNSVIATKGCKWPNSCARITARLSLRQIRILWKNCLWIQVSDLRRHEIDHKWLVIPNVYHFVVVDPKSE